MGRSINRAAIIGTVNQDETLDKVFWLPDIPRVNINSEKYSV